MRLQLAKGSFRILGVVEINMDNVAQPHLQQVFRFRCVLSKVLTSESVYKHTPNAC